MSLVTFILSLGLLDTGLNFTGGINLKTFGFETLTDLTIAQIVVLAIGVKIVAIWGAVMAIYRKASTFCTCLYGLTVICLITIPLLTEGSVILTIGNLRDSSVKTLCH